MRIILLIGLVLLSAHIFAHELPPEILAKLQDQASAVSEANSLTGKESSSLTGINIFFTYLIIGFEHIFPLGIDHILFIVGIFLFTRNWRQILIQVSCFTIAHTITLGMTMYGWIFPNPSIVEPLIAFSICYIAIENIFLKNLTKFRPLVIFAFGLLHGMGFAGVLSEIGLPDNNLMNALISFNIGVELGQLFIILVSFLCLNYFYKFSWYRTVIVEAGSLIIGSIGAYWTVARLLA
ncbi:HupE/UreJ family protein [Microbulbifer sp. CnH-101-G]|uniref:HupE/UreJ family protein n=1 Tax=Microbulbifer sp. CnH-101-G TaxID=3243393 RepID=UPI00403A764A